MTTELGTELGTSLGTTLGAMEDLGVLPVPQLDQSKVYALDNLSTANYYVVATPATGGEQGIAGGGFGTVSLVANPPAGARRASLSSFNGASGWSLDGIAAQSWRAFAGMTNGSNVFVETPMAGVGLLDVVFHEPGTANLTIQTGRGLPRTVSFPAVYRPGTSPSTDGGHTLSSTSSNGMLGGKIIAQLSYAGAPTQAQRDALADAIRTFGDIPSKAVVEALMPGCTVRHRWSLRSQLAIANVPVADGAAAPATIVDSVTGAAADVMNKTGSPIVRVLDPGAYPRTQYGMLGWSDTNYLQAPIGIRGAASGLTLLIDMRLDAVVNGAVILSNYTTTPGVQGFTVYTNTSAINIYRAGWGDLAVGTAAAADVGQRKLLAITWDGTTWQPYQNGVAGTSAANGMIVSSAAMRIGTYPAGGASAGNTTVYQVAGCDVALSAGEVASAYSNWLATGLLRLPSGKTNPHLYDLTQDVNANGGPSAGAPATVVDRYGSENLTRTGTGLVVSPRTERLFSYETSPILYGADSLSAANFFESASGLGEGSAQSFWAAVLYLTLGTSTNKTRALFGSSTTTTGFDIRSISTNVGACFGFYDNTNVLRTAPMATYTGADYAKLMLYVGVYDQPALKLRSYWKRAEVGTGTTITGYAPSAGGLRIGRNFNASDNSADGNYVFGVSAGLGLPSLAQVQALFDTVQATERIAGIPGMTNLRVDVAADIAAASGAIPSALADRQGALTFAKNGTPTVYNQYARAWTY